LAAPFLSVPADEGGTIVWIVQAQRIETLLRTGPFHIITRSCYQQLPLFVSVRARNLFVKIPEEVSDRHGFSLVGHVVVLEHIHLLINEPAKETHSTITRVLKESLSRRLRRKTSAPAKRLRIRFQSSDQSLPQLLQPRFYDFNVWSQKKFIEKLQSMHMNPMKRKLVDRPKG
jgi:putative transposase